MRLFFLMLLLLNGIFFVVNILRDPEIKNPEAIINKDIPQLALLSEKIITPKAENIQKTEPTQTTEAEPAPQQEQENSIDLKTWLARFTAKKSTADNKIQTVLKESNNLKPTSCYTAGPFQSSDSLQQADDYFSNLNIQTQQRSIEENHYIGMLVYLPSQENRQQVISIAEALAAKGVKDYMLLNEPGKQHSLSLGVYGLKKNAEKRIKTLSKFNYQAKSEARYRKKTVYWLDYAFTTSDKQSESSAQYMSKLKVSQIERNCKS